MARKINLEKIREEISPAVESALKKRALSLAQDTLNKNLRKYLNEIENHPVSKELRQGPDGENISSTLNGKENLFAFIGFESTRQPIDELTSIIKENTYLDEKPKFNKKNFEIQYEVYTPSPEEIRSATPLPFEGSRSWVKGIEEGISGFGYYVYGLLFPQSRSKRGIQSKNKVRSLNFRPVKYISEIYFNFVKGLK